MTGDVIRPKWLGRTSHSPASSGEHLRPLIFFFLFCHVSKSTETTRVIRTVTLSTYRPASLTASLILLKHLHASPSSCGAEGCDGTAPARWAANILCRRLHQQSRLLAWIGVFHQLWAKTSSFPLPEIGPRPLWRR